jgi:hypothetical protein
MTADRYTYVLLRQDEIDEMIAQTLLANERDLAMHRLNRERYEAMLPMLAEGAWKERIAKLLAETEDRIGEVLSILDATRSQAPDAARLSAALQRLEGAKTPAP